MREVFDASSADNKSLDRSTNIEGSVRDRLSPDRGLPFHTNVYSGVKDASSTDRILPSLELAGIPGFDFAQEINKFTRSIFDDQDLQILLFKCMPPRA